MGTKERKEREKKLRKEQIHGAAKEIFLQKGFRSTTMEDIAKKAELSIGAIYQYFKNKDDLYTSMNFENLQSMTDEIETISKDKRCSQEEKIIMIKETMYKNFLSDPLLLRVILHVQLEDTLVDLDKQRLEKINVLGKRTMNLIASVYEDGCEAGKFSPGNSMAHADIMLGIFEGLMMWEEAKRRINPEKDFFKPTLDRAFEIFCRGIRKQQIKKKLEQKILEKNEKSLKRG